ncbi:MAG: hypothetical protein NTW11_03430 [Candidatus Staskawiczbacteria bacterium]|nr:hypothetical protein [Candidatus Staskawiczbacteria bacterium]
MAKKEPGSSEQKNDFSELNSADFPVEIPLVVSGPIEKQLAEKGYTKKQINGLTPEAAQRILNEKKADKQPEGEAPKPEVTLEKVEAETEEQLEINLFQKQEDEIVRGIIVETTKVDSGTIKAADGFLAKDADGLYREFALEWFGNNEDAMKKEGRVIPDNASDEWKISLVLGSKEKGGMGAAAEVNKPEYKTVRERMDRIGVLRADIKKGNVPPETPFLLLNYLQEKFEKEQKELESQKEKALGGDAAAEIFVASKTKELEELFLMRKEIAEKTMGENLTVKATEWIDKFNGSREKYIEEGVERQRQREKEKQNQKKNELFNKEYQAYLNLPEKQRSKYQKKLGVKLEVSRYEFDRTYDNKVGKIEIFKKYASAQEKEEAFQKFNRDLFHASVITLADKNGIKGEQFYGLLEQGYKPHEIRKKGFQLFGGKKMEVPTQAGSYKEMNVKEYADFVDNAGGDYNKFSESQARAKLEKMWDTDRVERIKEEMERRIKELAESPEKAEGGIEKVYQIAKERIIQEYIKKEAEKKPVEKTPARAKKIEKEFGEGKTSKANKPEKTSMVDVYFKLAKDAIADESGERGGGLQDLTGEAEEDATILSGYLAEKLGVKGINPEKLKKRMDNNKSRNFYKDCWKRKDGLLDWFFAVMESVVKKEI